MSKWAASDNNKRADTIMHKHKHPIEEPTPNYPCHTLNGVGAAMRAGTRERQFL